AIALRQAEPRGVVRLSCPTAMLESRVGDMLSAFLTRHPLVELHVDATNRRVDVLGEGMDLAIRVRPPPLEDSDLVLRILSDRGGRPLPASWLPSASLIASGSGADAEHGAGHTPGRAWLAPDRAKCRPGHSARLPAVDHP